MTKDDDQRLAGDSWIDQTMLDDEAEEDLDLGNVMAGVGPEPPGVRLVNGFLTRMVEERLIELAIPAVDGKGGAIIRGKSESGDWSDVAQVPKAFLSNVVNRLKVMSDIDPITHTVVKTGSFVVKFRGREVEFETEFHPQDEGSNTQVRSRLPGS